MVRLVDLNSVATLACHFAPAEAGMSPMLGAIGEDEDGDDEDSYHVHSAVMMVTNLIMTMTIVVIMMSAFRDG